MILKQYRQFEVSIFEAIAFLLNFHLWNNNFSLNVYALN